MAACGAMVLLRSDSNSIQADIPKGWDARLSAREAVPGTAAAAGPPPTLLHTASFALPADVGDFGSGAVEAMGTQDAFVSLFEHDRSSAGTPLFEHEGVPGQLLATDFSEDALQRPLPGQLGTQRFFTLDGRAFCVYVVLGHRLLALRKLKPVNDLIASIRTT